MTKGIIGAGGIARSAHAANYQKVDGVSLAAVCDIDKERAEIFAHDFEIPRVYTDYKKLVKDSDLHAVSVCTPNVFHKDPTIAALRTGLHVLCEKPIAMNAKEGAAMVAAARKARRKLQVGLHFHFEPQTQALKRFIDKNEMGTMYYCRVQALRQRGVPTWGVFTNKKLQGGGPLVDIGVHMLYTAMHLLGFPKPLSASGATWDYIGKTPGHVGLWGTWDPKQYTVEDMASGYVRLAGGGILMLEAAFCANIDKDSMNVTILGDKGGCNLDPCQVYREEHGSLTTTDIALPSTPMDAHEQEIRAFVDAIRRNKPVPVSGEHALVVQKILDAIYKSANTKREVKIT